MVSQAAHLNAAPASGPLETETAFGQWHQRLGKYLDLRGQILARGGTVAEQQQAITALRNTTFSAPEERIRAQTYEAMRDNGDHRLFFGGPQRLTKSLDARIKTVIDKAWDPS